MSRGPGVWQGHSLWPVFSLQIYGGGQQTRSFQYVSDLVDGLMALMNSDYEKPVNLGNPEEYTIMEFAKLIKGLVGKCASNT